MTALIQKTGEYDWDLFMIYHVTTLTLTISTIIFSILVIITRLRYYIQSKRFKAFIKSEKTPVIGFFHP